MKLNRDSFFVYFSSVLGSRFVSGIQSIDDYSLAYLFLIVYDCLRYSPDGCPPEPPLIDDLSQVDSDLPL